MVRIRFSRQAAKIAKKPCVDFVLERRLWETENLCESRLPLRQSSSDPPGEDWRFRLDFHSSFLDSCLMFDPFTPPKSPLTPDGLDRSAGLSYPLHGAIVGMRF